MRLSTFLIRSTTKTPEATTMSFEWMPTIGNGVTKYSNTLILIPMAQRQARRHHGTSQRLLMLLWVFSFAT